jgi:type IV pilus assembly protein PilB
MKLSFNRLEDVLLAQGKITGEQHAQIRKYIIDHKISSAVAITELKIMDINGIYRVIAEAMNVEFVPIGDRYSSLDEKVVSLIPESTCKAFGVLPWKLEGNVLKVIIENPQDAVALREVRDLTGKKVVPVMAVGQQIKNITEHYFNTKHEKEKMIL